MHHAYDHYFIFYWFPVFYDTLCYYRTGAYSLWDKERTERRRTRNYYEEYDNNDG